MLQTSLSGDARISVICTLNPDVSAVAEWMSTLTFAQHFKNLPQDINHLKNGLVKKQKKAEAPQKTNRLSARGVTLHVIIRSIDS